MALTKLNFGGNQQALVAANIPTLTNTQLPVIDNTKLPTGSVLQTLSMTTNTNTAHSTLNTYTNTNLTLDITPSSTSNKILAIVSFSVRAYHTNYNSWGRIGLHRGSTLVCTRDVNKDGGNNAEWATVPSGFVHLDSPSSTSAQTYLVKTKLIVSTNYSAQIDIGEFYNDSTNDETNQQSLTLMEIKG